MALVLGEGATGLGAYGAQLVHRVRHEGEDWRALTEVLRRHRPHVLLIPATAWGRDVGPRAAGELELGMTGDCVGVDIAKAGRLLQQKPAYGGNIVSVIMGATTPQLATVRPRMYEPLEPRDAQAEERVETLEPPDVHGHGCSSGDRTSSRAGVRGGATRRRAARRSAPPAHRPAGPPGAPRVSSRVELEGTDDELSGFVKSRVVVSSTAARHGGTGRRHPPRGRDSSSAGAGRVKLHASRMGRRRSAAAVLSARRHAWGGRYRKLAEERLGAFHVVAPTCAVTGCRLGSALEPRNARGRPRRDARRAQLDRVDVVGHSWGGRLALELAARQPERVGRLVLLDPVVWVPPHIALERAEVRATDESSHRSTRRSPTASRTIRSPTRALVAEEVPRQLERGDDGLWRGRYARSAVVAAYGEMAKRPALDSVAAPTLLIRGRDSEVVPEAAVEMVLSSMPGCEIVTVPGGHIVMWDAFDETASAILAS